jgi:hypothetical protein
MIAWIRLYLVPGPERAIVTLQTITGTRATITRTSMYYILLIRLMPPTSNRTQNRWKDHLLG